MSEHKKKEVQLRVQEPDPTNVGRNIVTLDKTTKQYLGITSGDIVEIEGTKVTASIVWPSRAEDEGLGIIRMDNLIRHNAGVGLGEKVTIRKADYKEAKKIVLAPTQEVRIIASGYDRILKKSFIGRAMNKGDHVWISVFGSGFIYKVVDTNPRSIVKVSDFTQFVLKEEPVKDEEEGFSRISYEDIGGLDEPIRKIREMVELPMRHPELFRRLGIDPPKGLLLYGPPGTGKTLLAKAVANETNAHFISINAPSVMCVESKTPILTNPKGTEEIGKLFEFAEKSGKIINNGKLKIVELKKPKTVYSLSPELKIKKGKITHITKLKAKTIRIKTNLGENFKVSTNQPFAILDSFGNISWKTSAELKKGELIAIAKTLPEGKSKKFDYLKEFNKNHTFIKTKNKILKLKEFKGKYNNIEAIKIAKLKSNYESVSFVKLPEKTNPKLMRFLGLMYSEGSISNDGIVFTNKDPVLLNEFAELVKDIFGISSSIKKDRVNVYSYTLKYYLINVLGFSKIGKKNNYIFPKWFFGLPKKEISEFIRGFWEGNGTTSKEINGYPTIKIYSIIRNVLNDLSVLFRKLGIITQIKSRKTKFSDMFVLALVGNRSREIFAELIKSNIKKYSIVEKWYKNRKKKGDDLRLPNLSSLLKEIKNKKGFKYGKNFSEIPIERYISGRNSLTQKKLEEINNLFKKKNKKLNNLCNAQLSWCKIESIKEENETDLFDLTVEPYNNFLAGHSLMVLHNSKFVGEAEERLRQLFKEAEENAPTIIFIDEIDAIAPKREEVVGEVERRVVAQLLALMDGMEARGNVIVLAATNRINSIDEALRRPGRFDREIEIGVPDKKDRMEILQIHTRGMPLAKDVKLDQLAHQTHGFVGADLAALVKEAAMKALRRYLPKINLEEDKIPEEVLESLEVNRRDFNNGLKDVQPSALREVMVEVPNVKWSDIGALSEVKSELKQVVEWPLKHPDSFKKMGIKPPKGILLYGPPGTGKTLLAKAVANEADANFISIKGPELMNKFVGETERGIRKIFRRARQVSPVIIFFDEIDAIASSRGRSMDSGVNERAVAALLTEIDGIEEMKDVFVVAATNRPDLIDPALLRAGRLDKIIEVKAPNEKGRLEILKIHTKNVPLEDDVKLEDIAKKTEHFTGADLEGLVREASLLALKVSKMKPTKIKMKYFEEVIKQKSPTVSEESEKAYSEFKEEINKFQPSYVR